MQMIHTTTPSIEGRTIREYKGVVFGETIIGANILKDILGSIRDIVGGRAGSYEQVLQEARDKSMKTHKRHTCNQKDEQVNHANSRK